MHHGDHPNAEEIGHQVRAPSLWIRRGSPLANRPSRHHADYLAKRGCSNPVRWVDKTARVLADGHSQPYHQEAHNIPTGLSWP